MFNQSGPLKGANVTSNQDAYDLLYKDISVKSENRNATLYPNPNSYSINLNTNLKKIYKAEIIALNVPAATDVAVNITNSSNRLYFSYTNSGTVTGYLEIQAGTYLNPSAVASEVQSQLSTVLTAAGKTSTITVTYNTNLNRYMFIDSQSSAAQFTIYPINGSTLTGYTVSNSIGSSMKLLTQISTGPINVNTDSNGNLYISAATAGNYGGWGGSNTVPLNNTTESIFGNSIASDLVLVDCSIFLSLGVLNGDTLLIVPDQSGNNVNIPPVFCQIPNNTAASSATTKTLFAEPAIWSGVSFYNPPISNLDKLDVKWYDESGTLINILDHCFSIRVYYFQKRNPTTEFSTSVFNYAASGTIDSIYKPDN
jgi:hypothetical protein